MIRNHYRRATIFAVIAVLVLFLGFAAGWYSVHVAKDDRDTAVAKTTQAQTNEQAARAYLEQACAANMQSACQMLQGIKAQPDAADPNDPEAQDPEIQESEVQEPEIQDAENQDAEKQDPEIDDPDPNDPEIQNSENQDPEIQDPDTSTDGDDGSNGDDGVSVTGVSCNDSQNFVVTFSDGTNNVLLASDCKAADGADGQNGAEGPQGPQGPAYTPSGDTCPDGQYVTAVNFNDSGVVLTCSPMSMLPVDTSRN